MEKQNIHIKYYSFKLLQTVNLNALVHDIRQKFGEHLQLTFQEMNEEEKLQASEDLGGITGVRKRLIMLHQTAQPMEFECRLTDHR